MCSLPLSTEGIFFARASTGTNGQGRKDRYAPMEMSNSHQHTLANPRFLFAGPQLDFIRQLTKYAPASLLYDEWALSL